MHLPDGILPTREWLPLAGAASAVFAAASKRARTTFDTSRLPSVGFLAAVVLVLQMVNFPLFGGTSGHLTGTVFLAFVGGVEAAAIAMASVLAIQAFVLQDGGILALGANYLNMVVVPILCAMAALPIARRFAHDPRRVALVAGVTAWVASVAGSFACAVQLGFAGILPFSTVATWMCSFHAVIGLLEGLLTATAVHALARRGRLFDPAPAVAETRARWLGSVVALAVAAAVLVPIASNRPDGLESVLSNAAFARR